MRDEIVLEILKSSPKGVTGYDFKELTHFKDAIFNLRNKGEKIVMTMIPDPKGGKRKIGLWRYIGKQDTPFRQGADYQITVYQNVLEVLNRLMLNHKTGSINYGKMKGYSDMLFKCKLNKTILDFINREVTKLNFKE